MTLQYSPEVAAAGTKYLKDISRGDYYLPAAFRWYELFRVLVEAAEKENEVSEENEVSSATAELFKAQEAVASAEKKLLDAVQKAETKLKENAGHEGPTLLIEGK